MKEAISIKGTRYLAPNNMSRKDQKCKSDHFTHPPPCCCCCYCSVAQSCPTLCHPMDCSTPGLPVPHPLPKFAQVPVHCIGDAFQPSHPLMPSSSALYLSQHQGLFPVYLHQMTKILELQLQKAGDCSRVTAGPIDLI